MVTQSKKKILGVIPSKLGSKRFPRKALAPILGMPMVGHVFFRSNMCKDLDEVIVATPDKEIADYIKAYKGTVVRTPKGITDPLSSAAYAAAQFEKETGNKYDIIVVISGDEPMITNDMVANAISPLYIEDSLQVSCLMCEIANENEIRNPNEIKVVVDINNYALYFSREPIPSLKKGIIGLPILKKVNVMPFRRDFLYKLVEMPPTPLEITESISILRVLENGYKVKMVFSEKITYSVDTKEELEKVSELLRQDYLTEKYITPLN